MDKTFKTGDRVHVSGYSDELWIEEYRVSVDTDATVMETPNKNAKKILLTLDSIDGEGNVCCLVRKSKVESCSFEKYKDKEIEKLWEEFEDVLFIEDDNSDDSCSLVLSYDWQEWDKGTNRDTIWHWFDEHHSKGIHWLLYGTE